MQKLFDEQLSKKRMEERGNLLGDDWEVNQEGPSTDLTIEQARSRQQQMLGGNTDQKNGI